MSVHARILRLNKSGLPLSWVTQEEAATLYVRGQVIWSLGEQQFRLHGGINAHGQRSVLDLASIIACNGEVSKIRSSAIAFCSAATIIAACTAVLPLMTMS